MQYLPDKKDYSSYWVLDIEADSLQPTKIWCMVATNIGTGETVDCVGEDQIKEWLTIQLALDTYFLGHNAISYDFYNIRRLLGLDINLSRTVDTLVLSYLYDPGLPGGHSLASWGERFRSAKGDFKDFHQFSEEMLSYCRQDVRLTVRVFKALVERMRRIGFSEKSCEIEHEIRAVIDEQEHIGWSFDIPGATSLLSRLQSEQATLEEGIRDLFPSRLEHAGTYDYRTTKTGEPYASYTRHLGQYPKLVHSADGRTYDVFEYRDFNIGSPKQRASRLLELGWEPQQFTPTGQPKVDEESLVAFANESGRPAVQAIADWLVLQGRSSMIGTWLNNVNYDDGRMHGRVFTCGATTRRMTHSGPNTANIPKAKEKVKYGIECRRLWRATPGRVQVGYDAKGLEMRMFAEYLKNDEATRLFLEGDPHLANTRNLGLEDHYRDLTVKNAFYAYLYGAQDPKLGQTLRPELAGRAAREEGKRARTILESGTPGLARLVAEIGKEYESNGGLLRTIDGGFVRCPSPHAALNYKLQSAGAIVMKLAAIISARRIKEQGIDAWLVGSIHDEGQYDCRIEQADTLGALLCLGIRDAGLELGFKVPLDGDYKVGGNWAECH